MFRLPQPWGAVIHFHLSYGDVYPSFVHYGHVQPFLAVCSEDNATVAVGLLLIVLTGFYIRYGRLRPVGRQGEILRYCREVGYGREVCSCEEHNNYSIELLSLLSAPFTIPLLEFLMNSSIVVFSSESGKPAAIRSQASPKLYP